MNPDFYFIVLLFMLLILPKVLQRFGIPSAITSFMVGLMSGPVFGVIQSNTIISVLSVLGIVTLFLFAGLEADFDQLMEQKSILIQHVMIFFMMLVVSTYCIYRFMEYDFFVAALISIALLTPSTGFILDSLRSLNLSSSSQFWIKSKAIAAEIIALAVLFVVLQSLNAPKFALSVLILVVIVFILPQVFKGVARWVIPYAPKSEFTFLIMVAVSCAVVTKHLGIYYLVGAFIVGLSAQRFRESLPSFSSEKMMDAIELFSTFFIPFYFFKAGLSIPKEALDMQALILGGALLAVFVPIRIYSVGIHRKMILGEKLKDANRIGIRLVPTFVFTLVLVDILRTQFAAPPVMLGALIFYTIINTMLPSIILKEKPIEFDQPHVSDIEVNIAPEL
ncbi:MAG: cation:proton antiporter [Bdellovibrionota bacterium]